MKRIIFIFCILSWMFQGCNLDVIPNDRYTVESFWETESGTEAALNGCYHVLTSSSIFGGATPLLEDVCTPNAYNYDNTLGYNFIAQGVHTPANCDIINNRWSGCYQGIGRCNVLLTYLKVSAVSDERKEQIEGETKFLRALFYHLLTTYYGDVPLILEEPRAAHGSLPREERTKVVKQIISDLDDASNMLMWKWNGTANIGRVTKGAALALKARVLLFEASPLLNTDGNIDKWKEAAEAALLVIKNEGIAGYDLYRNGYRNLFLPINENNEEVVFDVQFSKTTNSPSNGFNVHSVQYRSNSPLLDLVNAYETLDGSAINTNAPYENRDPRLASTLFYPGSTFLGKKGATADNISGFTGFAHKKLTIYNEQARDNTDAQGESNYIYIRYADVLLMYAEALNESIGTPSNEVYDALNRVRERAGLVAIPYNSKTQAQMRQLIRKERRVEFAGEGLYYNDIRRWRTAEVVMNTTIYKHNGTPITMRAFDPDRDYWWPIPSEEIVLNPNLKQNPEY